MVMNFVIFAQHEDVEHVVLDPPDITVVATLFHSRQHHVRVPISFVRAICEPRSCCTTVMGVACKVFRETEKNTCMLPSVQNLATTLLGEGRGRAEDIQAKKCLFRGKAKTMQQSELLFSSDEDFCLRPHFITQETQQISKPSHRRSHCVVFRSLQMMLETIKRHP